VPRRSASSEIKFLRGETPCSVANSVTITKFEPERSFTLFPELPIDIRIIIWQFAMPPPRLLNVEVSFEVKGEENWKAYDEQEYDDDIDDLFKEQDENSRSIRAIDRLIRHREQSISSFCEFRNSGQLETYGFTSSRPKPKKLTRAELEREHYRRAVADRNTYFDMDTPDKPSLLHVCRESRELLQRFGFGLAFSTYTSPAKQWVNYSKDIFLLSAVSEQLENLYEDGILDGGSHYMGQCPREELDRVRRVAVNECRGYRHFHANSMSLPLLAEVVQEFRNLEELLLVVYRFSMCDTYWPGCVTGKCEHGHLVTLDVGIEEKWGHTFGWDKIRGPEDYDRDPNFEDMPADIRTESDFIDVDVENFEDQLRVHEKVWHPMVNPEDFPRENWSIPKVRSVVLLNQAYVKGFLESRKRFRHFIDVMYRKTRNGWRYRSPSPDISEPRPFFYLKSRSFEWYSEARESMFGNFDEEPPSPSAQELIEGCEAMFEMNSWP